MVITNPQLAAAFAANYPSEQIPGYSPDFPEPNFGDYSNCWTTQNGNGMNLEEALVMALALVLD